MKRVSVFCGSSNGARDAYGSAALQMGTALAERGLDLVYGAGNVGLMGVVANAVLNGGGNVIGVTPQVFVDKKVTHQNLTELHIVESMHERKALMAELGDAFIAMPGGFGTLEEFAEILAWAQLEFHHKPCCLLNIEGYFDAFLAIIDHMIAEQFAHHAHRSLILVNNSPDRLLDALLNYKPNRVDKYQWAKRNDR